jgi:tetratricopeptide (TPR) repeat protein
MHPWTDPVPLTRAWCLWEILCTIDQGVPLIVRLPKSERPAFIKALAGDYKVVMETLVCVQAEKATAKSVHDKETIFEAIRESAGGFVVLNQKVKDQLRAWLLEVAKAAVADMELKGDTKSKEYGGMCLNVGTILNELGDSDRAMEYHEKGLAAHRATVGENHPSTAASYQGLGALFKSKGKYSRAIEFHEKALAIQRATLGENHPSTAASYNNIGLFQMRV